MSYNEVFSLIPQEITERVKTLLENALPEDYLVCVAHFSSNVGNVVDLIASALQVHGFTARRVFLPCDETEFAKVARFILVVDALSPIVHSASSLFSYIAELPIIRHNLVIVQANTMNMPSPTEAKRNIRVVLEAKGIQGRIYTDEEMEAVIKAVAGMRVDVTAYQRHVESRARLVLTNALSETLCSANEDLQKQKAQKERFLKRQRAIITYSRQLKLDTWVMIQQYCDATLEKDVRSFAKQMMPELEKMIYDVDLQRMQYYFSSYLNYLWGQFLTNEITFIKDQLKNEISAKIEELLSTYRNSFCEEAKLGAMDPITVYAGSQPVSFDIEHYSYTLNNIFDWIIGGIIRFKLAGIGGFVGGLLGDALMNFVNKMLSPLLRIKYSNEKIRKMYSDVIYDQFYENIDDMVIQLRDYMVPALEKSFQDSVQEVIKSLEYNMEKVGRNLDQHIEKALQYVNHVQDATNLIKEKNF